MSNDDCEATKYPDWPKSFKGYGNYQVNGVHYPDLSGGPDPKEVLATKKSKNLTVTETCKYFGLSRVQVVKVVGE